MCVIVAVSVCVCGSAGVCAVLVIDGSGRMFVGSERIAVTNDSSSVQHLRYPTADAIHQPWRMQWNSVAMRCGARVPSTPLCETAELC